MDNKEQSRKTKEFIINVIIDKNDKHLMEIYNSIEEDLQNMERCLSYIKGKYNIELSENI